MDPWLWRVHVETFSRQADPDGNCFFERIHLQQSTMLHLTDRRIPYSTTLLTTRITYQQLSDTVTSRLMECISHVEFSR